MSGHRKVVEAEIRKDRNDGGEMRHRLPETLLVERVRRWRRGGRRTMNTLSLEVRGSYMTTT